MKKLPCNDAAFDVLTPEVAYWAGVRASDGNVRHHCSMKLITLKMNDRDVVEKFKSFMQSEATIHSGLRYKKRWNLVQINSRRCFDRLGEFGIVPRKSLTLRVADELVKSSSFWRGAIDGDGNISLKDGKYSVMFLCSASAVFIEQFRSFLLKHSVESGVYTDYRKKTPLYSVQLSGERCRIVLDLLYREPGSSMDRKRMVAERSMAFVDARLRVDGVTAKEDLGHGKRIRRSGTDGTRGAGLCRATLEDVSSIICQASV